MYTPAKKIFFIRVAQISLLTSVLVFFAFFAPHYDTVVSGLVSTVSHELTFLKYKSRITFTQNKNLLAGVTSILSGTDPGNEGVTVLGDAVSIPVLVYHGIVPSADRFSLTSEKFQEQIFALKNAGYKTISLDDLYAFKRGEKDIADKSFVLTFDDGRRDSYENADPIIRAAGFKAVMFIAVEDSYGTDKHNPYYLNAKEIKEMVATGRWEIGSHAVQDTGGASTGGLIPIDAKGTMANFLSSKMWLADKARLETTAEYTARVHHELADSKIKLEEFTGMPITAISYPFSDYGQQTKNYPDAQNIIGGEVRKNYTVAFQQIWPIDNNFTSNYKETDWYHMRRVEVGTEWTGDKLLAVLNQARAKPVPYVDTFEKDNGWKKTWGVVDVKSDGVHLDAATQKTGAFSFLDGTFDWTNYLFVAKAHIKKGSNVSLIARFQSSDNYLSCTFNDETVKIEEVRNGNRIPLVLVKNIVIMPRPDAVLGIFVDGSDVKCLIGNRVVAYAGSISSELSWGGIGAQIWDEQPENASLILTSVNSVPALGSAQLKRELPTYPLAPIVDTQNTGSTVHSTI